MSPNWEKYLHQITDPTKSVQLRAIQELGNAKITQSISDLSRLIEKTDDDDVKLEAIIALGRIEDPSVGSFISKVLQKHLDANDIPVMLETITTLGALIENGYSEGILELEALITHSNFRVRKFVISALGKTGTSNTIEKLFTIFRQDDTSLEMRELIAEAIGNIGGSTAMKYLNLMVLPNEEFNQSLMEVRRAAIKALGEARNPKALELLGKILNNKDEDKIIRKYTEDAIKKTIEGAKANYLKIKTRATEILKGK